jgi:N-sulfoglucosamine sulfohydrolase
MGRPNVVVFTCHDLGRFLGCYGVPTVATPHLDALAADGVLCTRAFCTAPQCSPSRASLFTGRYPHCNGVMGLTHAHFAWDLHPEERHLAQVLREAGYTTVLVGVHHESRRTDDQQLARRCGYDEVLPGGRGEAVSAHAMAALRRLAGRDRPFFLQVGYVEPHRMRGPGESDYIGFLGGYLQPDAERGVTVPPYLRDTAGTRAELAELQGAVRYVDAAVGQVLGALRELGLDEETLVVFTSDHGVALPRAKCSLYDPGLEIPLIFRWPGRGWRGGRVCDALISNLDVFPTILEAAGLSAAPSVQGRSLTALLDGRHRAHRDAIFAEMTYHDYYDPRRAIRTDRYKLIVNFSAAPAFMDPTQSWRPRSDPLVPAQPALAYHPPLELYDLEHDPHERADLAADPGWAEVRQELLARLHAWMVETADPLLQGAVPSPMHRWALEALSAAAAAGTAAPAG